MKQKKQKQNDGSLSMLLGTLGAGLFGNLSARKRVVRAGKGTVRAS